MHDGPAYLTRLKAHCLANGIQVRAGVIDRLSRGGTEPLTIHEYPTTGGITLRIGDVYLNAPFDDWFCDRSRALLAEAPDGGFEVRFAGEAVPCDVLPLPGYLASRNSLGQPVTDTTMSHCDRIRVSPIAGCALDCGFCDVPSSRYRRRQPDEVLASVEVAKQDRNLPAHHLLISGGSPGPNHFAWFDDTVCALIEGSGLRTDVMMSAREGDAGYIERYAAAGIWGFSFNLEVFGHEAASRIMPRKHDRSSPHIARTIEAALTAVGGNGRVRSLVIVGLEDTQTTLRGIEFLASLGCEPVLSPFRPARGSALAAAEPPTEEFLLDIHERAQDIVAAHGLRLGPRCIPCQHNTLVIPDGSLDYYYTADHEATVGG